MYSTARDVTTIFTTLNFGNEGRHDASLMGGTGEAEHGSAKIKPEHLGSLDTQPIREVVEELLESGREAFEMRRLKYGF